MEESQACAYEGWAQVEPEDEVISDVLRDVLNADATVTAEIGTFEFSTGFTEPAIFTTERPPDIVDYPIVIIDDLPGANWGTRGSTGGEAFCRVFVYGNRNWNLANLRNTAWIVKRSLDRAALDTHLSSYGYAGALCIADPPGRLDDPDGFPGFVVNVRVKVLRA